ncbi:MAG: polysaccharide biosynthesis tyrosine autokinase [Flavobacteriaceae bacterium]|nr:polysaccharide biosynthesis tyrosine autokinase [Flavobacteriaceae bacterium]
MENSSFDNAGFIKDLIGLYLSKWKWIMAGVIAGLFIAFVYLRYAKYEYQVQASIKLKNQDENDSSLKELQSMQNYGMFTQNSTIIEDEIEILNSVDLITKVADDLDLNIQYFTEGKVHSSEVYKNPPISLSFFASDSIIHKVDTTFTIIVNSVNEFTFDNKEETEKNYIYEFGAKISTSYGGIVITPNFENGKLKVNDKITVKLNPLTAKVAGLRKRLGVTTATNGSNILKLSLKDAVKERGIDILNSLISQYNNEVIEDKRLATAATFDFINERLQAVSAELSEVDLTAEIIQKTNRLTDLDSQSSLYLASEQETEARLVETNTQLELVNYMSDYLSDKSGVGELIPSNIGIVDVTYNTTTAQINELVQQRNRILKNSTEKNPTIVNLDGQINTLRKSLNQSLSNIKSSNQIRLNALQEEDRKLSGKIYSAPKKQRQSRDLTRQQNIKESLYLYLLEKREEMAIALGITTPNAKVIDKAFSSIEPVSPKRGLSLLAGLVLGELLPIGSIYLIDMLDTKVKKKSDLAKLTDVAFLGEIPHSKKKNSIVKQVDYSPKAEAFRLVRTNIDFMLAHLPTDRAKIIFVTSTTSKEGKSHTAINLASSLSYSNKRVLIIETDIRMPKVNAYLKMKIKDLGLTDFIGNPKLKIGDVLTSHESNPNLHLISSGTVPPNPAELLMSDRMKVLFDKVKNMYDYVIVDTAAVGLVTDTLLISQHADLFVYVIRAGHLDKSQLNTAQTMYEQKRLPNMSILLNDVQTKKGYGYGYGNNPNRKKTWWKFAKS